MRSQSPSSRSQVARRGFFQALSAATIPLLLQGCDSEEFPQPEFRCLNLNLAVDVQKAQLEQAQLLADPCCCSIPEQFAGFAEVGDQIRVIRNNDEFALYTVSELCEQDDPSRVRMALHGRKRLDATGTFAAQIAPATNSALSDAEAEAAGEFVERLDDNGQCTGLIVLAPHGGGIEPHTDTQAELVEAAVSNSSSWRCKGWRPGGGAHDRWHITSTMLSRNSFPGLKTIANRGFDYAVAFHGMSAAGVIVGGGAPVELRALVRNAIAKVLDNDAGPVILASEDTPMTGDSPSNVVNWLTTGGQGGVQLEQSMKVRSQYGQAVAEAVAGVFAQLV
jgi:phage replication-related protein YjqB (UPF0714/DUF867 family)